MTRRFALMGLILATIFVGLASRSRWVPELIYPYIGDMFYAVMFFFITAFLWPKKKAFHLFIISTLFCFLIECSQLIQTDGLNEIRQTRLGGLVLGFGFLWSDLISYTVGGFLGFAVYYAIFKKKVHR